MRNFIKTADLYEGQSNRLSYLCIRYMSHAAKCLENRRVGILTVGIARNFSRWFILFEFVFRDNVNIYEYTYVWEPTVKIIINLNMSKGVHYCGQRIQDYYIMLCFKDRIQSISSPGLIRSSIKTIVITNKKKNKNVLAL